MQSNLETKADEKDSPNNQWAEVKLHDGRPAYFKPSNSPQLVKHGNGDSWKLRQGVVAYPADVKGKPAMPEFATTGVMIPPGSKLDASVKSSEPRIESNSPALVSTMVQPAEKIPWPGLGGAKSSFPSIEIIVLLAAIGFAIFKLRK